MNHFNKEKIKILRAAITDALSKIEKEYSIKLKVGNATYTDSNIKFKLEVSTISDDGTVNSPGMVALRTYYPKYVEKKVILSNGIEGTIIEYHSKKHKYPFIVQTNTGIRYKISESMIKI